MPESTVGELNTLKAFLRTSSASCHARERSGGYGRGLALARAMYGKLQLWLLQLNTRDRRECVV